MELLVRNANFMLVSEKVGDVRSFLCCESEGGPL
jgi:hypothetical protein